MKSVKDVWVMSLCCMGFLAVCFIPELAHAAVGLGEVGKNLGNNFKEAAPAVKYGAALGGAGFAASGVKNLYDSQKGQGQVTTGAAAIKIMVGAGLLGLAGVIQMASVTAFGSDQATGVGELNL